MLAESAVKTEHKKDDIVELAVAWAPKDYSGANWNALLLRNFVNRALDEGVKSVEGEVYRAAVNLGRHDKYGRYKDKLAACGQRHKNIRAGDAVVRLSAGDEAD